MANGRTFKNKLRDGEPCIGAWLLTTSADNAEILSFAGLDFILIDHEHGQGGIDDAVGQLRAIKGTACVGIVRVPTNDHIYIKRVLDAGAHGIMVPNVGSAEEARYVVSACRYAPAGMRGAFGGMRAMDYGFNSDYYRKAAEDIFISVQVESSAAIDRIAEIAAVDGIDLIFIGPRDLSASLGKLNQFDDPQVRGEIERAERAILASGKLLGSTAATGKLAAEMAQRGYSFIIPGSDVTLLGAGVRTMLSDARAPSNHQAGATPQGVAISSSATLLETTRRGMDRIGDATNSWSGKVAIRKMRQFWFAWGFAMLLLALAVIGGGYMISISADWPTWTKILGRSAAGLIAALALYDAYRMAVKGTEALQQVLAHNLAVLITIELEALQVATLQQKQKLDSDLGPALAEHEQIQGLKIPACLLDRNDVQKLLGDATEESLRNLLDCLQEFNLAINDVWLARISNDQNRYVAASDRLKIQIDLIGSQLNQAIARVAFYFGRAA